MGSTVAVVFTVCLIFSLNVEALRRVKRIIGGAPADVPPSSNALTNITRSTTETPTSTERLVFVKREQRSAVVNGIQNEDGTYSFLGLRYAEPPVGKFRFQRPRRVKLKGEIDATRFGPPCPQWSRGRLIGNEDCLFLNIFTPELRTGNGTAPKSYPVLFWIHGGNFMTGSASQYIPNYLVRKGIIVVTVQYRLGSLGFLSIGRKELPGNTGLFDIATGLRWVYDFIKYFGGDAKAIVPGGQGSGASVATMLALNKYTGRLIKGVLSMSGSPVSPFSLDENEVRTAKEVSQETVTCSEIEGVEFVRCMQKLPLETVLQADSKVQNKRLQSESFPKGLANLLVPGPSEEGKEDERFLPNFVVQSPLETIKQGLFPSIPLLIGVTKDETGGGIRGNFLQKIQKKLLSPRFLQTDFFKEALIANNGLYINRTVNPKLNSLFLNNDYVNYFNRLTSSPLSDVDKTIQYTTDAFFNLPTFITSHMWSKKSNVFLYSFEHTPTKSVGEKLLSGIPLISSAISQNSKKNGPEHGDDLAYLFDIRSIEGNVIDDPLTNEADVKVREHFSNIVAEFVRSGTPRLEGGDEWKPFTTDNGDYMVINDRPKLLGKFHKCAMGLWTGETSILSSSDCSVLNQATEAIRNTIGSVESSLLSHSITNRIIDRQKLRNEFLNNIPIGLANRTQAVNELLGQRVNYTSNTLPGGENLLNPLIPGGGAPTGNDRNSLNGLLTASNRSRIQPLGGLLSVGSDKDNIRPGISNYSRNTGGLLGGNIPSENTGSNLLGIPQPSNPSRGFGLLRG